MVTVGSTRAPNILENVFSPGLNRFWRKTDADTHSRQVFDSNISNIYADLFDGNAETAIISGGVENMYYLSDFPLAQKPTFGDANLVGVKLFFYVSDINRNEIGSIGRVPEYKFFLVDHNIGKDNEGTITPYPTGQFPNSPLAVFSSNFSKEGHWQQEMFSGGGTSKVVNGRVLAKTGAYLPYDWAKNNATDAVSDTSIGGNFDWNRYASNLPNGDKVIFVEKTGWGADGTTSEWWGWDNQWTPTKGRKWQSDDPEWMVKKLKGTGYPLYAYETESTITVNPPADTENTFFDEIKVLNTKTLYGGEGGGLAHGSQITFDSTGGPSGGSTLKMESVWAEDKSGSLGWSSIEDSQAADRTGYGESDKRKVEVYNIEGTSGTKNTRKHKIWVPHRQRGVVVKKIPTPVIYNGNKGMDYSGRHGKSYTKTSPKDTPPEGIYPDVGSVGDKNITTSEIQIDMKIEELSAAPFFLNGSNSWNNPTDDGWEYQGMDARNVAVTLGTRPPRDGETFFDYYYNTRNDGNGWADTNTTTTSGKGAFKDRDGMMTGFVIARPAQTDYNVERRSPTGAIMPHGTGEIEGVSTDVYTLAAVGSSGTPGNTYTDGAEQWPNSGIGYTYKEDGLTLIPFINNPDISPTSSYGMVSDGCNWVNGSNTSGELNPIQGAWNYWSVMGGLPSGTASNGRDTYGGGGKGRANSTYNDYQYLMFARAAFRGAAIERYTVPIPDKEWLRIRIFLNGDEDKIYFQIEDVGSGEILGRTFCEYNNNISLWSNPPTYLSIWCNNFPGTENREPAADGGDTGKRWWGESQGTKYETRTTVFIDNITLKNFNMQHKNASVSNMNQQKRKISINRNTVTNSYLQDTVTPNYISFGFENTTDIDGNPTYLLFNSLASGATTPTAIGNKYIRATMSMVGWTQGGVELLGMGTFQSTPYANGTTGPVPYAPMWLSPFEHVSENWGSGNIGQRPGRGLSINDSEPGGAALFWDGTDRAGGMVPGSEHISSTGNTTDIENFSYKGLMKIDHTGSEMDVPVAGFITKHYNHSYAVEKRENQWVSARIMDFDLAAGEITVDDPSVFSLKEGLEYRIYARGRSKKTGDNPTYQDVYLSTDKISSQTVKIKTELNDKLFNPTETYGVENNLWIGPKLAWIVFEVLPYDSSYAPVEDRTYSSVVEVNRAGTAFPTSADYGVTFNEITYNDGVYQNAWSMDYASESSDIVTDLDFGFGSYDTEKITGGEVAKIKLHTENLWHVADLSPLVDVGNKQEGDIVTTLMVPQAEDSFTKSTMHTIESTTKVTAVEDHFMFGDAHYEGVFRPFLLTTFEDKLPTITDFEIRPSEGRPFLPEFTWSCKDDDIWYGFIIVDDEQIRNQYHKALLHIPLNIPKKTNKSISVNPGRRQTDTPDWYSPLHKINSITLAEELGFGDDWGSMPLVYTLEDMELAFDPEGLSGWCHRFTQPNSGEMVRILNYFSNVSNLSPLPTFDSLPKKEMSLVMHIVPDYQVLPTGTKQTLFDNGGGVKFGDEETNFPYWGQLKFFKVYIDVNGYLNVEICPEDCHEDNEQKTITGLNARVALTSKTIVPMDGETPTNIIVTLDAGLKRNNVKLFINGKLEDTTGRSYTASNRTGVPDETSASWDQLQSSSDRWPFDTEMAQDMEYAFMTLGNLQSVRTPTSQPEPYRGRMEEVVYYPICIYPVDVDSGKFILEKPFRELSADNKSKSYSARLFVKDYHNIRGTTKREVASTASVAWRKSVPLFTEASD